MSKLTFYLRSDKTVNGQQPLELRFNHNNERGFIRTGIKAYPCSFDSKSQQITYVGKAAAKSLKIPFEKLPTERDVIDLNSRLSKLLKEVKDVESRFILDREEYTAEAVVTIVRDNRDQKKAKVRSGRDSVCQYITDYVQTAPKDKKKASLVVYNTLAKHLRNYESKYNTRLVFADMDLRFMNTLRDYLFSIDLLNSTVAKQLSGLKTFLNYARREGVAVSTGYMDYRKPKNHKDKVFALNQKEFDSILELDLTGNKRLSQVRDLFIFSCSTGLRFSDLSALKWVNVKDDHLLIHIKKTRDPLIIPLNSVSSSILSKYSDLAFPLPKISNQKANKYIKEVGELAGLIEDTEIVKYRGTEEVVTNKRKFDRLSMHCGRRTFISLALAKNYSPQIVMRLSNHNDYKSFERYVNIDEAVKKEAVIGVFGKPVKLPSRALKAV